MQNKVITLHRVQKVYEKETTITNKDGAILAKNNFISKPDRIEISESFEEKYKFNKNKLNLIDTMKNL